jgi:glutathione S-transferase
VLPSDDVYKTIILPMTSIAMIPVLLVKTGSKTYAIQDSKAIMEFFETRHPSSSAPLVPRKPKQRFASMLLELLADEWLVVQAMYWRWAPESLQKQKTFLEYEFGHASTGGRGSFQEKLAIGQRVQFCPVQRFSFANDRKKTQRFASFCPGLGITPSTSPALLKQFHVLLELLSTHLEQHDFLLGPTISVADFAFYGTFYAHLTRDPVPGFVIKTQAPLVASWIERIGLHRQTRHASSAPNVDGDDIPATLLPILRLLMADFGPILHATATTVLSFLARNPSKEIPRHFRPTPFRLRLGADVLAEGTRNVSTHCVWMLQRILDSADGGNERHACEDVLHPVDVGIAQQWHATVELWQRSGWRVARNQRNQLVGQREPVQNRL